ncbi:MAG: tRNA (5-methylaminomethyl-2-thiouridine)(34)-methyltransferase MnmD [Paracoccaceae bacterium]
MTDEASLDWREGHVPVSRRFGDPYFSVLDGLAETRHVFLDGNDLTRRFEDGETERFAVGELGFGTGLSFLACWQHFVELAPPSARLDFTSFEIAPLTRGAMFRALSRWPELKPRIDALLGAWTGPGVIEFGRVRLEVIDGDARRTLPAWPGMADAWFLDGFAPARNPEMWEPALLRAVFAHTGPGGSCATYSAAGAVRRGLSEAGFRMFKRPGFGTKRDMLIGRRPAAG